MKREDLDQQDYKNLEEKLVAKVKNSVSTMAITSTDEAFTFLKGELELLSKKYPDTFYAKKAGDRGMLFGFWVEVNRYEVYGEERPVYIHLYRQGTDKRFEIKVGGLSSVYKFDRLDSGYGYKILKEGSEKDHFGLVGVHVNTLLVTTLLDKMSKYIDSMISGTVVNDVFEF